MFKIPSKKKTKQKYTVKEVATLSPGQLQMFDEVRDFVAWLVGVISVLFCELDALIAPVRELWSLLRDCCVCGNIWYSKYLVC